jgi:hypothetical protein
MKTTKESLVKENAVLKAKIENIEALDLKRREVFSELLGSYEFTGDRFGYGNYQKKILVRDWLGISFLIGELKADADYAIAIENNTRLRNENESLKAEIKNLTHPQS